ncbi:ATP-binding protein [Nocardioides sp.]|jgi:anti-sigma regulatory factor (Ser/Thr protein kinase)|uniref:ATP-binding protein n=1 Tax=Nocardioides sp. TaxID=35761 RepID=UPI002630E367|nr:ATP-binding protein [Nocardioides sp.]
MRAGPGVDLDAAVAQVLDLLGETSGVTRVGLALPEGAGRRLRFTSSDRDVVSTGPAGGSLDWCHIDAFDDVPLTTVVRTGESVIGGLETLDARFAEFVDKQRCLGVRAVAALPLHIAQTVIGGVVLFYEEQQRFGSHQVALLEVSAVRAAVQVGQAMQHVSVDRGPHLDDAEVVSDDLARFEVEPLPVSVALSRRFARRHLTDWKVDDDVADTAILCLSELVTNVVMHAASRSRIELSRRPDAVRLSVRDHGSTAGTGRAPEPEDDPLSVHGRGLQLVAALADEWGSDTDEGGTTVWCTFSTRRRLSPVGPG